MLWETKTLTENSIIMCAQLEMYMFNSEILSSISPFWCFVKSLAGRGPH